MSGYVIVFLKMYFLIDLFENIFYRFVSFGGGGGGGVSFAASDILPESQWRIPATHESFPV